LACFQSEFCHLFTDDFEIAVARVRIVESEGLNTLTLIGAFECSIDTEVRLECWHERLVFPAFVDAGATIWAHKSEELQILTQ